MSDGPAEACAIIAASMPRPIRTSFGAARLGEAALAAGPLPQARACAELALALSRAQMSGGDEACRLYLLGAITAREEPVSVTAAEDYCLRGGRTG